MECAIDRKRYRPLFGTEVLTLSSPLGMRWQVPSSPWTAEVLLPLPTLAAVPAHIRAGTCPHPRRRWPSLFRDWSRFCDGWICVAPWQVARRLNLACAEAPVSCARLRLVFGTAMPVNACAHTRAHAHARTW